MAPLCPGLLWRPAALFPLRDASFRSPGCVLGGAHTRLRCSAVYWFFEWSVCNPLRRFTCGCGGAAVRILSSTCRRGANNADFQGIPPGKSATCGCPKGLLMRSALKIPGLQSLRRTCYPQTLRADLTCWGECCREPAAAVAAEAAGADDLGEGRGGQHRQSLRCRRHHLQLRCTRTSPKVRPKVLSQDPPRCSCAGRERLKHYEPGR